MLYGRWNVRAKLPPGHFWPAIWLMPAADICCTLDVVKADNMDAFFLFLLTPGSSPCLGPRGGEVDLMEPDIWNGKPLPYIPQSTYHYSPAVCYQNHADGTTFPYCVGCDFSADFHTYSVDISPRAILFIIDNQPFHAVGAVFAEETLPQSPMYLILGQQLWSKWNYTEDLPASFEIDSVEAWTAPSV